jgi:hypothetical protein
MIALALAGSLAVAGCQSGTGRWWQHPAADGDHHDRVRRRVHPARMRERAFCRPDLAVTATQLISGRARAISLLRRPPP